MSTPTVIPSGSRGRGGLLRRRDFRLLWIGETVSSFGSAITTVAMPLVAVATLHSSTFVVGILAAASWLPWLVVGLPAGAWVDRMRRRRSAMLGCDVVSALLLASVPIAAWLHKVTMSQLMIVALLAGTAAVFFNTAYTSYLPAIVDREDLVEGNAKLQGSSWVARLGGPSLAGVIAQEFGSVTGLFADAISFLISAFCLLRIGDREVGRTGSPAHGYDLRGEIGEGLRFTLGDPYLRTFACYASVANLMVSGIQALLVVFLVRTVHAPSAEVGLLMAASGCGGIIGALCATRLTNLVGNGRAALLSTLCLTPFGLMVPLTTRGTGYVLFFLGLLLPNCGVAMANIIIGGFRQSYAPEELLARTSTSMRTLNYGSMPVGALLGGALGTALGPRAGLTMLFGGLVLSNVILMMSPLRRHHELPSRPSLHPEASAAN